VKDAIERRRMWSNRSETTIVCTISVGNASDGRKNDLIKSQAGDEQIGRGDMNNPGNQLRLCLGRKSLK
jgi:hypothetical protein